MPSWNVLITRDEAQIILAALDDAARALAATEHITVLLDVEEALAILTARTLETREGPE